MFDENEVEACVKMTALVMVHVSSTVIVIASMVWMVKLSGQELIAPLEHAQKISLLLAL
jgi:hypothetical protein